MKERTMDSDYKQPNLTWTVLDSRVDRQYNLFSVQINRSRSPGNGKVYEFQVLNSPDWVCVIPLTPDNEVVMVRQYRHGAGELTLEPPGGLVKDGQSPEQSGREELEEETGYTAGELELLGWMNPMPALFTNRFYVFVARDVRPAGRLNPDETEEVETVLVPAREVRNYVRSGRIRNSVMIAALHLFFDRVPV